MSLPQRRQHFSPDDYLDWECGNVIKHEYLAGEVFAMAGAKDAHVTVSMNIAMLLRHHLRGGPCRVYMADMKVRVEPADAFFYPDVVVTCDDRDHVRDYFKCHPTLIVEVLSDSTAAYDRGLKFVYYRQLDSLREYLIVDPDRLGVEVFRRAETGWVFSPCGAGDTVELASVGLRTTIEALYEDVLFLPARPFTASP